MNKLRGYWLEVLILLAICLQLARVIWFKEIRGFESSVFTRLGVNPDLKYLFTVPAFLFVLYLYYKRDAQRLAGTGRPVVSKGVVVFAGTTLVLIAFYLYFFVAAI